MTYQPIRVLCLVGTLILLGALAASAELLLNPDFETWTGAVTADNWTQYQTNGTVTCQKGSTFSGSPAVAPHGGSECQRDKLDAYNEEGGVYQSFATTAGTQYAVSVWILTRLTSSGSVEAKMGVDTSGALVPGVNTTWSSTVVDNSAWTQKSVMVTATGPYVTVFLDGRHPENSTGQCNAFFDDASALACSPPAAPTSAAANPSTINSGQSSTLSASVAAGCTVDWYSGSCGGSLVSSGTSIVVSPMSTTTYYPRARNTTTGCVSGGCGSAATVTVNVVPGALNRPSDPVVLTGSNVPSFYGVAPGNLVAFKYSSGWQQLPVQVDERAVIDFSTVYHGYVRGGVTNLFYTDPNTWTGPDSDTTIDSNDEIVFMAADSGAEAPYFSQPAGVVSNTGIKVTIADPVDPGKVGYVYLFRQNGSLDPGAGQQYASYTFNLLSGNYKTTYKINSGPNAENSTITTAHYKHHFADRWKDDELHIYTGGASGVDILDRHKNLFAPSNCARSEDTFCNGEGAFVVNKSGPVRALRSYVGANSGPLTQRDHICYARRQDINTYLRVHAIGGIMDFFDYSPNASGMIYRNNNNTTGVTVDGGPDAVTQGLIHWEQVDGAQGGLTMVSSIVTNLSGITPTSYYLDDSTPADTQCTGDAYAYGASGTWINQGIDCTDPAQGCNKYLNAIRVLYYDPPGQSTANAIARHNWAENSLACTFSAWQDTTAPTISSVALNPTVVAASDSVSVTANASDSGGVASVKANGLSLAKGSGSSWTGAIPAASSLGSHTVTVVATDNAGNTRTDSSKSYQTQRVLGTSNRAVGSPIMNVASSNCLFVFWGRVTVEDADTFTLDDGLGIPVRVHAPGYSLANDDYARARGRMDVSVNPPVLRCLAEHVSRLN